VVNALFSSQVVHIVDSVQISEPIRVERGGIPISVTNVKIVAYADDLSIGISSPSDWSTLLKIFSDYEKASNAVINKHKSILIPITNNASRVELSEQYNFKTPTNDQEHFTFLGYSIDIK
ncbi:4232_t:CDS:2, partial [Gigaspora rosea]